MNPPSQGFYLKVGIWAVFILVSFCSAVVWIHNINESVFQEPIWERCYSKSMRFSVLFPKKPEHQINSEESPLGKIDIYIWLSQTGPDNSYYVSCFDFPTNSIVQDPDLFLEGSQNSIIKKGFSIISKEEEKLDGHPGMKFQLSKEKYHVTQKVFLVGNRVYLLGARNLTDETESADIEKFLNSFFIY